jgi:hypothetical protein
VRIQQGVTDGRGYWGNRRVAGHAARARGGSVPAACRVTIG